MSIARDVLLHLSVGAELFEIGPKISGFLLILDAGEDHFGAGDLGAWILDVFQERCVIPGDAGILVGVGIVEIGRRAGTAAIDTVELGADLVLGALADGMTGEAL